MIKIAGIANGVLDIFYFENKFDHYIGGGTSYNILSNLTLNNNYELFAAGNVAKCSGGDLIIKELENIGVSTKYILRRGNIVRKANILVNEKNNIWNISTKASCPRCGASTLSSSLSMKNQAKDFVEEGIDLVIFDSLKKDNIDIALELHSNSILTAIDIGYIGNLRYLSITEIKKLLSNLPFDYVQLNGKVAEFLVKRFGVTEEELFKILNVKLMAITNSEKGAIIYFENNINYIPNVDMKVIDSVGAGDAFFAGVIDSLIDNKFQLDNNLIDKINYYTKLNLNKVLSNIGARSHIYSGYFKPLYNIEESSDICKYCGNSIKKSKVIERKNKKLLMTTNVENIYEKIKRAMNSNYVKEFDNMLDILGKNVAIIGAGASYTLAQFIKLIIDNCILSNVTCFYPRDIEYLTQDKFTDYIICSRSGNSNDIKETIKSIEEKNPKSRIHYITQKDEEEFDKKYDIVSYFVENSTKERGFLSIESIIVPAVLATEVYLKRKIEKDIDIKTVIENIFSNINIMNEIQIAKLESFLEDKREKLLFDIFYDLPETVLAEDIESKSIESGIARVTLHEKKNFSHGRFNIIDFFESDLIIYYILDSTKYNNELMKYLNEKKVYYIKSEFQIEILKILDMLIQNQYFFANLGEILNRDLTNINYKEEAMKLYKFKGNLK